MDNIEKDIAQGYADFADDEGSIEEVEAEENIVTENSTSFSFEETTNFLNERYGQENAVAAVVHYDETTPHLHYAFVPVVFDNKKSRYKVSAKEVLTRHDLQTFHDDLDQDLKKVLL